MSRWITRSPRPRPIDRRSAKTWSRFWIAVGLGVFVVMALSEFLHWGIWRTIGVFAVWVGGASAGAFASS